MPSRSKPQHKLMEAAAHTQGGYDGVPQSVGREFVDADKSQAARHLAKGDSRKSGNPGSALGRAMQSGRSAKLRGK